MARAASDGPDALPPDALRWLVEGLGMFHEPDGEGCRAGNPWAIGDTCRAAGAAGSKDGKELRL